MIINLCINILISLDLITLPKLYKRIMEHASFALELAHAAHLASLEHVLYTASDLIVENSAAEAVVEILEMIIQHNHIFHPQDFRYKIPLDVQILMQMLDELLHLRGYSFCCLHHLI